MTLFASSHKQPSRLALFDFDGTLCDSAEQIVSAIKKAGNEIGFTNIQDEQARQSIGQGLHHFALKLTNNDEVKANEFFDAYKSNFRAEVDSGEIYVSPLFEGAQEAVISLVEDGWFTGVVTNKGRAGLNHLLQTHGISHLFDLTFTVDEKQPKPSPEMVLDAINECGVGLSNTVLVGDTIYDAQCTSNAGISFVGVGWGYNSAEILTQYGARMIVNDFSQLNFILSKITSENA